MRLSLTLALWAFSAVPAGAQFPVSTPLPGDLAVLPSAGTQEKPSIAFGGSHYLCVWEDGRSGLAGVSSPPDGIHANRDVYATLLDHQGSVLWSSPLAVDEAPWDQLNARVAWNGTHYLVVWESTRPTQFYRTQGIYAARVDPAGVVLDQPPIVIDDQDDYDERFPELTSDGSGWMVAWTDNLGTVGSRLDGAYVDGSGLVLFKRTLVPSTSPLPTNYRVSHAGDRFAAIFERNYSSGIGARLYDAGLTQVGAELSMGAGGRPALGSNGSEFYAAWNSGGVLGTPITTSGAMATPGGALLSGALQLNDARVAVAWDGTQWVAGITGSGAVHASQVTPGGTVVAGSPFTISAGNLTAGDAAAANGNGRAVLAWTHGQSAIPYNIDPFDIYGTAVTPLGPGGVFPLTLSPPAQVHPAVAGEPGAGYLVAFQSRSTGLVEILAQRVAQNGAVLDATPIVVASGGSTLGGTLDVAFDGARWLVVWSELMPGGPPYLYRTFARRVNADGSLPDPAPIDLQRGEQPVVAALAGEFLVASHFHYPPVQSNEIYHYKRLRGSDGVVVDASEVPISFGSGTSDLIAFDDRWLFAWGGISAAFILGDGSVQPLFQAAASGSASPSLARNGDEALLTFVFNGSLPWNADVRARRIHKDGTLLDLATGSFVSSASNGQLHPRALWYGAKYMVAFTDYRDHPSIEPGVGDVYAARLSAANQVLDNPELPAQNRWPAAEGRPALAGGGGRALLVSTVLDGAPFGQWRVHRQLFTEAAPPLTYCTAKVNSLGCTPQIGSTGLPSTQATSGFLISASNVQNQKVGLLLYGTHGRWGQPFQGGTLCVRTPVRRSIPVSSQGSPLPAQDCSGVYQLDMNAFAHGLLGGNPDPLLLTLGTVVDAQWWGRDPGFPALTASTLSAGLEYEL